MANIRAIRARIKSVESTRQITASMKMIAASKLRRVQAMQASLENFERSSKSMLQSLMSSPAQEPGPYVQAPGSSGKVCYVVFVGNRGMCGVYNISLVKYLQRLLEEEERQAEVLLHGRWGKEILSSLKLEIAKHFDEVSDTPGPEEAQQLSAYLLDMYLGGRVDEIRLVYQEFHSILKQEPACKKLLPLDINEQGEGGREYIFEPDADSIRRQLERMYVENSLYSTALEARRGEHAARMAAMTAAADNTDELLKELELQLNHARQASITTEISEIVGGAAALRED